MSSGLGNKAGQHRRERSIGSMVREREEELALFQSMRIRDQNYLLHPSSDDVEGSLSEKSGSMSECNWQIPSTPARKTVNDLLNSELGKHDYDWLLTPPGTPLFPYLEHEKSNATRFHQNLPCFPGPLRKSYPGQSLATGLSHSSKVVRSITSPRQPSSPSHVSMTIGTSSIRSSLTPPSSMSPCSRPSTPSKRVVSSSTPTPARPSTPTRPSSPMRRPLAPTSRPPSPMKRPLAQTARPSTPTTRPSAPSASLARPSTPSGRPSTPTARPTTPTARPSASRPSTPTGRPSNPVTRSSTPSGRSSISTARPASPTTRSLTQTITRSSTQITRPTAATMLRPTSITGSFSNVNQTPNPLNGSPNARPNSPLRRTQTPLLIMPEVSLDAPPNLRTTLPQRSRSASRGTSLGSRPGGNGSTYKSDTKDVSTRSVHRATSPGPSRSSSRAVSPSPSRASSCHDHDPPSSRSSKDSVISAFSEKATPFRLISTRSKVHLDPMVNLPGRASEDTQNTRSSSSSKKTVRPSATKETSFVGGKIVKKPTDLTVRHMDVYRSPASGYRPHLSNGHISSLYTRTSSLLRPPGNLVGNLSKKGPSGFGSENAKSDDSEVVLDHLLKAPDKGNSVTQTSIFEEENVSICSKAQKTNEEDLKAELNHLQSEDNWNYCCQESPQACKGDSSVLRLPGSFQGHGTGQDPWQHSMHAIEHPEANELRVDTWQSNGFQDDLESVAPNAMCSNMLANGMDEHRNDELLVDMSTCQRNEHDTFSSVKSSIDRSCNESSKFDELSTCPEIHQCQKSNLALLESRLRQDLAFELMLTFGDQSEGSHMHVNAQQ